MSGAIAPRGTLFQRNAVTIAEVIKIQRSGSKADMANVTNMDSGVFMEWLPTLLDSGEISIEMNLLPGNAAQASLLADFNGQVLSSYVIELPSTAGHWSFSAYVTSDDFDLDPTKQATKSVKFKITGAVTYTAGS